MSETEWTNGAASNDQQPPTRRNLATSHSRGPISVTMKRPTRRRSRGDRGVALVEFALILPFLAVLVFGVIDLGRAYQFRNRVTDSAREGGALAQFSPTSIDSGCDGTRNVEDRAIAEDRDLSEAPGFQVQVDYKAGSVAAPQTGCKSATPPAEGNTVVVTVEADFDMITPLIGGLVGDPLTIRRSVEVVPQ